MIDGVRKNTSVEGVRLTETGRFLGPIVAGAMLSLEIQSMANAEMGMPSISLQEAMGNPIHQKGRLAGPPTRLAIYEALLGRPDQGLSQSELTNICGVHETSIIGIIRSLLSAGILLKEGDLMDKRRFALTSRLSEIDLDRVWALETFAMLEAALRLQKQGLTQITLKQWVETGSHMYPRLLGDAMRIKMLHWLQYGDNESKIPEIEPAKDRYQTRIVIAEEHRDYLRELLRIRDLLIGGDSEAAADFRKAAQKQAVAILDSPDAIARLMRQAKEKANYSAEAKRWIDVVPSFVPPEGISVKELHRKVEETVGRKVDYKSFHRSLNTLDGFEMNSSRPGLSHPELPSSIKPNKQVFPANWAEDAACRNEDPELFDPPVTRGVVSQDFRRRVQIAKNICNTCAVRLPCLREALEHPNAHEGIRGGKWFRFIEQEMTEAQMERTRRDVEIQERPAR